MLQHCYFINLDRRTDRLQWMQEQLPLVGLPVQRFPATAMENGAIGCSLSHLKLVRRAIEEQWDHLLVLEDDVEFTNPKRFQKQLAKFLRKHPLSGHSWDVLLLAGNVIPPVTAVDDTCVRFRFCQTTTAYLVNGHYLPTLEQNFKDGVRHLMQHPDNPRHFAIDKYWFQLQERDRWLLLQPLTVTQRHDYSDIQKEVKNYRSLMLKPLVIQDNRVIQDKSEDK